MQDTSINSDNNFSNIRSIINLMTNIANEQEKLNKLMEKSLKDCTNFYYFQIHEKIIDNINNSTINLSNNNHQKNYFLDMSFFIPDKSLINKNLEYQFLKFNIQFIFPIYCYPETGFEVHVNNLHHHIISKNLINQSQLLLLLYSDIIPVINNKIELFDNKSPYYYSKGNINEILFTDFIKNNLDYVFHNKLKSMIKLKEKYFNSMLSTENLSNHNITVFIDENIEKSFHHFFSQIYTDFSNQTNNILQSSILPHLMNTLSKHKIQHEYHLLNSQIKPHQQMENIVDKVNKI